MKKILVLGNSDIVFYNFRKELILKLLEEKYDVYLCSPYGNKITYFTDRGCKFIETKINRHGTNPVEDFTLFKFYKKLMKKVKPDIVLTYTIKPNIYGAMACQLLHIPCIANITGLGTAVENGGIMEKITKLLYKISFRRVDTVFFQNNENQQFFINNGIAVSKNYLLPGSGVNLEEFNILPYPSENNGIHFVFISRIMREKGIDLYLYAAKKIKTIYPNTYFHVCGFYEDDYKSLINEYHNNGIIIYHGMVDDIREMLKITHCTIHPSYYPEGLSNALLESSACARPIITTNRSGCREVVNNLKNGYVVPIKDQNKLIDAIISFLSLIKEEREQMGIEGRNYVESKFDRNIVINKYLETIRQVGKQYAKNQ